MKIYELDELNVFILYSNNNMNMEVKEWLSAMKWSSNPFTFAISPDLLVGYKEQIESAIRTIEERHKLLLILGPTGSGKTTFLKWLIVHLNGYDTIYVSKPPAKAEQFVDIFNEKYKGFLGISRLKNLYQVPQFLNKKLGKKRLVVFFDEAQESSIEVLEWLRVLSDQVDNMSVVLAGLPVFEEQLASIETFRKRVAAKIELLYLTKEETEELIRKRIKSVGGNGDEFNNVIGFIYEKSAGFPREVIRICNDIVNNAIIKGTTEIMPLEEVKEEIKPPMPSLAILEKMTPMQREILEMLSSKSMTPGDIANTIDITKYKSRQHAVRSINNVVKNLLEEGYLERVKQDKAFVYNLAPRIKTMFVRA